MNHYVTAAIAALIAALLYDFSADIVGAKLNSIGLYGFEVVDVLLALAILFLAY